MELLVPANLIFMTTYQIKNAYLVITPVQLVLNLLVVIPVMLLMISEKMILQLVFANVYKDIIMMEKTGYAYNAMILA